MAVSLENVVSDAQSIAGLASLALQLGGDVAPFLDQIIGVLEGRAPLSESQRAQLLSQEQALRAQLQAPLSSNG